MWKINRGVWNEIPDPFAQTTVPVVGNFILIKIRVLWIWAHHTGTSRGCFSGNLWDEHEISLGIVLFRLSRA